MPWDDHPDNEPHPDCVFELDLYGYDEGNLTATYRFDLHAPTGDMMLMEDSVAIGEDPAGGGRDLDASVRVDLTDALATSGVEPHPQQGYHVRATVHAEGSIGADVKHKMFWVECATDVGGIQDERGDETEVLGDETEVLGVQHERGIAVQGELATTGAGVLALLIFGAAAMTSGLLMRGIGRRR